MRVTLLASACLLAVLSGCQSESADGRFKTADEEVIESQIEPDTKASIDSMAKETRRGRLAFPLPDSLTTLLSQRKTATEVAPFPDQVLAQRRLQIDNPLYLTGDFNGNQLTDYAVQVLENDSIHILAFLDYARQAKEVKVASYPAQKLAKGYYSVYQLQLAPKDSVVNDYRKQQKRPLGVDGVTVVEETKTTLYVFKNNRFIPFDTQK